PTSGIPWISEEFQPYGSNLPRDEEEQRRNTSHESSPMPPSFAHIHRQTSQDDTPVRNIRTVGEVENEMSIRRLPTPAPNLSTSTELRRDQAPGSSRRSPTTNAGIGWGGELQKRWRQYCEEEDRAEQL